MPWPTPTPEFVEGLRKRMKGNTYGSVLLGNKNGRWKGNEVGYQGMHHRLRKVLRGKSCTFCGKSGYTEAALDKNAKAAIVDSQGRQFSRLIEDYMPLCASCHRLYDKAY